MKNKGSSHAFCEEIKLKKRSNRKSNKYQASRTSKVEFGERSRGPIKFVVKLVESRLILINICLRKTFCVIIPHQKLLQSDWSFTHQHFRSLDLSPFESCHMTDIMLPRKPKVLPSKLDWFPNTIEAFWEKLGACGFSMRLTSYVKVRNCSSLAIYRRFYRPRKFLK